MNSIKELLSNSNNIIIVSHKNPDGDAIGSCLALFHYLKKLNQNPTIIVPNDYPEFLKWLPNNDSILKYEETKTKSDDLISNADIIFALDFNAFHRTGDMMSILDSSNSLKIMIDHHQQPDDFATYTYSDTKMSSTCEMVYHFIDKMNNTDLIGKDIATCIYVGIMTDTGSFRYSSTTNITHNIISSLIEKGANNTLIHNNVYDTNSYNRLQLLGKALNNLIFIKEYHTAYISLTQKELRDFNYKKGDTEGIVNYALSLNRCKMAAIFIEDEKQGIIKISLRSKGSFSVNQLSRAHFEGGGHTNAAGGKSDLNLKETIAKFISILPQYKNALQNEI
ncbi:bifunctional oligoribonuclease/PAP phosphatase NrnA [Aurantibacter sp.]|uniref:DHH family phosphoesterase n=1 Tax=Aurantibacter sp. TaxID=2807103 RepID=UPI0035C80C7E